MKTNVTMVVQQDGNGKFVGIVRSAKTGREMFTSAPKADAGLAHFAAAGVIVDRKWNEVTS